MDRAVSVIARVGRHFASAWMRTTATVTVATVVMMFIPGIAAAQTPKQAPIPTAEQTPSAATVRSSQPEFEVWRKTILKTPGRRAAVL